jgi:hypothetical protein
MASLWSEDRVLIRRIHGLLAIDPELGAAFYSVTRDDVEKLPSSTNLGF